MRVIEKLTIDFDFPTANRIVIGVDAIVSTKIKVRKKAKERFDQCIRENIKQKMGNRSNVLAISIRDATCAKAS